MFLINGKNRIYFVNTTGFINELSDNIYHCFSVGFFE